MGEDGKRGKIKRGSLLLGAGARVGKLGMGMISVCKNWIILPTAFRRHTHTHTGRSRLRPRCSKRKLRWKLGHRRCRGDATKGMLVPRVFCYSIVASDLSGMRFLLRRFLNPLFLSSVFIPPLGFHHFSYTILFFLSLFSLLDRYSSTSRMFQVYRLRVGVKISTKAILLKEENGRS